MGEADNNQNVQEQDLNQLLKVRREKLAVLQEGGKNPFEITKYDASHHSTEIKENFESLEGKKVTVGAKVSSTGKIFGSVTTIQIAEALEKAGFPVERKNILIKEDSVKEVGSYTATVKLHRDVKIEIAFEVISE